jgi:hypothetical protein
MKWATITTALLPLVAAHGFTHQQYASGEVMDLMMSGKEAAWAKQRAAGAYDNKRWAGFSSKRTKKNKIECKHGRVEAVKGDADQTYKVSKTRLIRIFSADNIIVQEH